MPSFTPWLSFETVCFGKCDMSQSTVTTSYLYRSCGGREFLVGSVSNLPIHSRVSDGDGGKCYSIETEN